MLLMAEKQNPKSSWQIPQLLIISGNIYIFIIYSLLQICNIYSDHSGKRFIIIFYCNNLGPAKQITHWPWLEYWLNTLRVRPHALDMATPPQRMHKFAGDVTLFLANSSRCIRVFFLLSVFNCSKVQKRTTKVMY